MILGNYPCFFFSLFWDYWDYYAYYDDQLWWIKSLDTITGILIMIINDDDDDDDDDDDI